MERRSLTVLHVGCGPDRLPAWLPCGLEVRLDCSPRHNPDICASMTDMGDIGPFDAIYSSHALEHVSDPVLALREFRRVLKESGKALLIVPDTEGVDPTDEPLYESPAGPITGRDMYYGHHAFTEGRPEMRHCSAFTADTLRAYIVAAGFRQVTTQRLSNYNLMAVATK